MTATPFCVSDSVADRLRAEPQLLAEEAPGVMPLGRSATGSCGKRPIRIVPKAAPSLLCGAWRTCRPFVLVEAGGSAAIPSIRRLVEAALHGMALPAFATRGRDLRNLDRSALEAEGLTADPDALAYLATHLGSGTAPHLQRSRQAK